MLSWAIFIFGQYVLTIAIIATIIIYYDYGFQEGQKHQASTSKHTWYCWKTITPTNGEPKLVSPKVDGAVIDWYFNTPHKALEIGAELRLDKDATLFRVVEVGRNHNSPE